MYSEESSYGLSLQPDTETQLRLVDSLYLSMKRLLDDLLQNESFDSVKNCDKVIRVVEQTLEVVFLNSKKLTLALQSCHQQLVEISHKIESLKPRKRKKKKKKLPSIFINDEAFKKANGKFSFYFRSPSSALQNESSDFEEIISSGHKFTNCVNQNRPWTLSDADRLTAGIRNCVIREKLSELKSVFVEINNLTKTSPASEDLHEQYSRLKDFLLNVEYMRFADLLKDENDDRDFDWSMISNRFFKRYRTPVECQRMWHLVAKPSIKKNKWTMAEDLLLRQIVMENGYQNWSKICRQLGTGRSEFLCFTRYQTVFKTGIHFTRKVWTQEENAIIEEILDGKGDFIFEICEKFQELSRSRILNHVNHLRKIRHKKMGFFSRREQFLVHFYTRRGHSYSAVAQILGNRSAKQIRDYHASASKKRRHGLWNKNEIYSLLKSVKYWGEGNWGKISQFIAGRSALQCRLKFFHLIKKNPCLVEKISRSSSLIVKNEIKNIQNLLKKRKQVTKVAKGCRSTIDEKIEFYFMKKLERQPRMENIASMGGHVLSLLKFLKFQVIRKGISLGSIANSLAEYPSLDQNLETLSQNLSLRNSEKIEVSCCRGNTVFSRVLCKYNNILPPNKCCIYGLHTFMENYESFAAANNGVDFEKLWKKIDIRLNQKKEFIEAKIQWFRILKAMFYWPFRLKFIATEQILNS